jgi:hypothetical protein
MVGLFRYSSIAPREVCRHESTLPRVHLDHEIGKGYRRDHLSGSIPSNSTFHFQHACTKCFPQVHHGRLGEGNEMEE